MKNENLEMWKLKREKDESERRNEASGEGIILLSLISKSERSKFGGGRKQSKPCSNQLPKS